MYNRNIYKNKCIYSLWGMFDYIWFDYSTFRHFHSPRMEKNSCYSCSRRTEKQEGVSQLLGGAITLCYVDYDI